MATTVWRFICENVVHTVKLDHGTIAGKRIIWLDGNVIVSNEALKFVDTGSNHPFYIGKSLCVVRIEERFSLTKGFAYSLILDGELINPTQQELSSGLSIKEVIETIRTEEAIGDEQRIIDNSKSSSQVTRRFTISKEWSQIKTIEYEQAELSGKEIRIGVENISSLGVSVENSITTKYTSSNEQKHSYSEEITLEIPAKTKLRVTFSWKRIWQNGIIKVCDELGNEILIPYRVVVGVTFDQTQIDEFH